MSLCPVCHLPANHLGPHDHTPRGGKSETIIAQRARAALVAQLAATLAIPSESFVAGFDAPKLVASAREILAEAERCEGL